MKTFFSDEETTMPAGGEDTPVVPEGDVPAAPVPEAPSAPEVQAA